MADEILLSIVTPSYNQGRFIEETIQSVLHQNYSPLEYIVMDGGSTDTTLGILKKYADRFTYFSEKDRGQAHAINKGWKMAKGGVLAWLNSDDTYEPNVFNRVMEHFKNCSCDMVYGKANHITADGKWIEEYPTEPANPQRLLETCYISQPAVFIRRSVLERVGYLNESLAYCMDYEYWLRIFKSGLKVCYVPELWANTRFYEDTKTSGQRVKVHKEIAAMLKTQTGAVPISWIHALAHAVLEKAPQQTAWQKLIFALRVSALSLKFSLRYNHSVSSGALRLWRTWIQSALRNWL